MKRTILALALTLTSAGAALAMPAVGDQVGTNPPEATAALAAAGCNVTAFEAEDGGIEAKCTDAAMKTWEIYIDPKGGAVTRVKAGD